jgi:2-dehydropantoate 2-reductase
MRVLVIGAGVIGSVYGAKLLQAGHEVVMLARGERLADLRSQGLLLEDAESGQRTQLNVPAVAPAELSGRFDVVLVAVRHEQLGTTLPLLTGLPDRPDVLFFGNTTGSVKPLTAALGGHAIFGFPAVGGTREGATVTYVMIRQQSTMVGEPTGVRSARVEGCSMTSPVPASRPRSARTSTGG